MCSAAMVCVEVVNMPQLLDGVPDIHVRGHLYVLEFDVEWEFHRPWYETASRFDWRNGLFG